MKNKISINNGITLVSLVVTIVVLLILAGVSLGLIFNSDGLFKKASGTTTKYNEAKARETLETVLMGHATSEKYTNKEYNQDEYLDEIILTKIEKTKVNGDIAIVDGYCYELDRSVPKIGKYLGKEEDLIFPTVSVTIPVLTSNDRTASFTITAVEATNGISSIEVIQYGKIVQKFDYTNVTDTINEPVTVKRNGKYTIKAYSKLTGTARIEVTGIVAKVEFKPNGNEAYKKEHSTTITVKETGDGIRSLKYQWLASAVEPEEASFAGATECTNGAIVTGGDETMTGTYFLWVLLETESGKKNICGSGAFNYDNEGPEVTLASNPESETSFTLTATADDSFSEIKRYEFYVNNELKSTQEIQQV